MEEDFKRAISNLTEQIRKFLESCKAEGDTTIEDVLRRLEDLKKEI